MDYKRKNKISNYKNGINSIIILAVLSFINSFAIPFFDVCFLYSLFLSELITSFLAGTETIFFWASLFITSVLLIPYIICARFAKKHYGFMIAALVMVSIDTLILVGFIILSISVVGFNFTYIMNFIAHVIVIVELVLAVASKDAVKYMKEGDIIETTTDSVTIKVLPNGETISVLEDTVSSDNGLSGETVTEKRRITVSRKKCFYASLVKFDVVIDGVVVGTLKNGQSLTVMVSAGAHALYVQFANGNSNVLEIPAQTVDKTYELKTVPKAMGAFVEITEIA